MIANIEKQNYYMRYIRDISLAFVLIWLVNPQSSFSQVYNWNIYGLVLMVWVGAAFVSDNGAFLRTLKKTLPIWLWPCYLLLASLFGHAEFSIKQLTTPFIMIFFVYYMRAKKSRLFKIAIFLTIAYAFLIIINTISQNIINPQVSRYLAHGNANETFSLSSPILANFYFVYAMTGVAIAVAALFKKKFSLKILNVLLIALWILLLILFIQTEYMIATLSVVINSTWIFSIYIYEEEKSGLSIQKLLLFLVILVVVIMVFLNAGNILQLLYNMATGDNIRLRLNNLISLFNNTASVSSLTRPQLYMRSISTFFSSIECFFFGVGYNAGIDRIGQHSQIFDTFGRFGIIGGLCWISGVITSIRVILSSVDFSNRKILTFVFLELLIISVLNPTYTDLLLVFFFFIIPEIVLYLCSKPSRLAKIKNINR